MMTRLLPTVLLLALGSPSYAALAAAADLLRLRFGISAARADEAEAKMLPPQVENFDAIRAKENIHLLQDTLGLSDANVLRMTLRFPSLMAYRTSTVSDAIKILRERLKCSGVEARKIFLAQPAVLGYNFEPSLAVLQRRYELDDDELRKMAVTFPSLLGLSFDDNIAPTCTALQRRLRLSDLELRKVLVRRPSFLGLSLEDTLLPALDALEARLGLGHQQSGASAAEGTCDDLRHIVVGFPQVLGLSFEDNLEPSLDRLQTRLRLSDAELSRLVMRMPAVLGYNWKSNLAKLDWLQAEFELSPVELKERVCRLPALLGYSIEGRYKPRLRQARGANLADERVLSTIAWSPARFEKAIAQAESVGS